MRISREQIDFLKNEILAVVPDGDLDIMVLANRKIRWKEKATIRWHYFEKFGEQKLDIISSTFKEEDPFKQIVLHEGVRL